MAERGYLTHAFNSATADYLRMAYCLALSLRATQSRVASLSVVVPESQPIPDKYRQAFDKVIPVADDLRLAHNPEWRIDNYVRLYDLSPYAETVTLDSDMLFYEDVSAWWDALEIHDVAPAHAVDYRGRPIANNPLRENLYEIGLPDLHNGFLYFRKGAKAREVFTAMRRLAENWSSTRIRHFGRLDVPFSSDCLMLLALRETGLESECQAAAASGIPRFVHMKACLQGWDGVPAKAREWRDYVDYSFDDRLRLTIGGLAIKDPLHYHVRDFIDDTLLIRYEELDSTVVSPLGEYGVS